MPSAPPSCLPLSAPWHGGTARHEGFTLVELLIVVAMIGILSSVAIPNIKKWAFRSKRAEAHMALGAIYKDQAAYFALNNLYGDSFEEIGFHLDGGVQIDPQTILGRYYTITVTALTQDGRPRANYRATAAGDIDPEDPVLDILIIENQLTVPGP